MNAVVNSNLSHFEDFTARDPEALEAYNELPADQQDYVRMCIDAGLLIRIDGIDGTDLSDEESYMIRVMAIAAVSQLNEFGPDDIHEFERIAWLDKGMLFNTDFGQMMYKGLIVIGAITKPTYN